MRKYSEVIANLNQTLQSEINRLSTEKGKSISGSEYSDYDLGEYGRLSSLLKLYSKKDTIEPLVETVEELKSEVQLLSERGDQLDALESRSEYDKSRLNETIQVLKQVSNTFLYYLLTAQILRVSVNVSINDQLKFKSDSDHNLLPPNQVSMHLYNDVVFYVEMLPCVFLQNIYPWDFMVTGKKKMNCSTCFAIKRDVSNVASCSMYT